MDTNKIAKAERAFQEAQEAVTKAQKILDNAEQDLGQTQEEFEDAKHSFIGVRVARDVAREALATARDEAAKGIGT